MRKVFCLATAGAFLLVAGCAGPQATPESSRSAASPRSSAASPSPSVTSPPATSPTARSSDTATPPPTDVPATLRFRGTKVDGGEFDGANLVGRPVLLWFWAPWCPVCRSQTDQVRAVARDHEGKVHVVGVGSLDGAEAISRFAANAPGITHLSDESGAVWRHFEVTQQSSFVLLDNKGTKVYSVGYGGSDELADRVKAVAG